MVFGGLLGPTFNYVFEKQMEDLQDGDRFYYLSRTAGLNLLTQLEGNSFAELIMRNTDVTALPADVFSRPDFVFEVANLGTTGPVPDDVAHRGLERGHGAHPDGQRHAPVRRTRARGLQRQGLRSRPSPPRTSCPAPTRR